MNHSTRLQTILVTKEAAAIVGGALGALKNNPKAPSGSRSEGAVRGALRGAITDVGAGVGGIAGILPIQLAQILLALKKHPGKNFEDVASVGPQFAGLLLGAGAGGYIGHKGSRGLLGEYGYKG